MRAVGVCVGNVEIEPSGGSRHGWPTRNIWKKDEKEKKKN
jgi:hypothetical protein